MKGCGGCRYNSLGGYCAAFGVGLLIATIFPPVVVLVCAAAALVLLGVSKLRCR